MRTKLNKLLLKSLFGISLVFLLPVLFFTSCKSTSSVIPGEQRILLENLYIEYSKLGDAYFSLEKYSEAITYYQKAMEDKELYWPCYYKVAKCYVYNSDWNHALEMYKTLLEKDPENSSLKASIAYIHSMRSDFDDALKIYDELLLLQPNNEKYIENYLAIILGNEKIFTENREKFDKSFSFFKENFAKNTNITIFQKKYDEYAEKLDKDKEETKEGNTKKEGSEVKKEISEIEESESATSETKTE